jgi:hypothetical protein
LGLRFFGFVFAIVKVCQFAVFIAVVLVLGLGKRGVVVCFEMFVS